MSIATNGHHHTAVSEVTDDFDGLLTPTSGTTRHVDDADWQRYEGYVAEILEAFGLDLSTPGTADTPRRFLRAIHDATDGYDGDPKLLTAFPTECRGGANCELAQVVEGPIPFAGLCEHHVLPFVGRAWVGYVAHEQIIGISKLTRLVRVLTRRFGVQERMTHEIADSLQSMLSAHGTAVFLEANHLCTQMRGVREHEPMTRTTAWRGAFVAGPGPALRVLHDGGDRRRTPMTTMMSSAAAPDAAEPEATRATDLPAAPPRPGRSSPSGRPTLLLPELPVRGGVLPPDLHARFAAPLEIPLRTDRPAIALNFVSTLDGVVALDRVGASGGREISGGFEPDRFTMGLLRASADAVLVGAGTVRASGTRAWTPGRVHPPSAAAYSGWRREMGLTTTTPATVVVSASGDLRPDEFDLSEPDLSVILLSTSAGARRMRSLPRSERVEIVDLGDDGRVSVESIVGFLRDRGFGVVLSEGGPTLFGQLLAAGAVDDLFLTVAPQVAGRSAQAERLSLVEGIGFAPGLAPWGRLRSVMRSEDYLFLRYDLGSR